jgi:hypothetical protein|uniref:Small terminase subunit n=1 Tax=Klebsiella phage vB_Kp_H01 TaxID=3161140 RepID=A0AAU8BDB1_9CAUD|nr:MAG TPA: Small terminase subunit [Caudoviricetes sp.]
MSNKHAASEDQVGILHAAVTNIFNKKAAAILNEMEEDPKAALVIGDSKDLAAMAKWVLDNGVKANPAENVETSALSKRLKKIREASSGKVISFTDAKEA